MGHERAVILYALVCAVTTAVPVSNDTATATEPSNVVSYRLPKNTAPMHYSLKLIPDLTETSTYEGEVVVKLRVLEPTFDISLHSANLTLNENETRLTFENGDAIVPRRYDHNNETNITRICFDRLLPVGVYTLHLRFLGTLSDNFSGFFKDHYEDSEGNQISLVATQFEPIFARNAFPCWDEPALKATFDISIKHYPNYTAMSNMPVSGKSEIDETDGKTWTHFERTLVMSTYLVAFVVADFANVSNADGTINAWSRRDMVPHLKFAHELAQKVAAELERYTNTTVRVPKTDHVVLPRHFTGAMENWGLITYPESSFVYVEGETNFEDKMKIIGIVTHELAHQWFGNIVGPTWWSHLWLSEGFASYFAYYIMNKILQGWRIVDYFAVVVFQRSFTTDTEWHLNSVDANIEEPLEITYAFSQSVYDKAPSILSMLSNIISPEVFRTGIIRYLDEYEYGSADPDSLWRALQGALDESGVLHYDFEVKEVMDTWIKNKRYPLIFVNRDYSNGTVTISQKDFGLIDVHEHYNNEEYSDESIAQEWWVPINFATSTNPDFSDPSRIHWLKPKENLTIHGINPDDWIILNIQQSGYYRVTYDNTNWSRIAAYLLSENFTKIHVLNRGQIINDITDLLAHKVIDTSIFREVVSYLSHEVDYVAWGPMFDFLEGVKTNLYNSAAGPIKNAILNLMDNLIKDVGFEERTGDDLLTILKRSSTLEWACDLGHSGCREAATAKFMEHFNNPETKISPNLKSWVYKNSLRSVNKSVWNKVFKSCIKNPSDELFGALGNTENPRLLEKYLNAAVSNDTAISDEHRKLMLVTGLDSDWITSPLIDVVIEFATQRWDDINDRLDDAIYDLYDIFYVIQTNKQLKNAKKFCSINDHKMCKLPRFWREIKKRMKASQKIVEECLRILSNT